MTSANVDESAKRACVEDALQANIDFRASLHPSSGSVTNNEASAKQDVEEWLNHMEKHHLYGDKATKDCVATALSVSSYTGEGGSERIGTGGEYKSVVLTVGSYIR